MLTFPTWKQMRRYGCDGPTRAMRGNSRRRELMAQIEARTTRTLVCWVCKNRDGVPAVPYRPCSPCADWLLEVFRDPAQ